MHDIPSGYTWYTERMNTNEGFKCSETYSLVHAYTQAGTHRKIAYTRVENLCLHGDFMYPGIARSNMGISKRKTHHSIRLDELVNMDQSSISNVLDLRTIWGYRAQRLVDHLIPN